MIVLSQKFPGSIHICTECHAVLAYSTQDVYENHYIYCPLCKAKQLCAMDLSYDGAVKNANTSNVN